MNLLRIKYIFSLVFIIGFFVILVLVFIIESSDQHNMSKGENSYINELDMLLGVITAAVGQILNYWFSKSDAQDGIAPSTSNEVAEPVRQAAEMPTPVMEMAASAIGYSAEPNIGMTLPIEPDSPNRSNRRRQGKKVDKQFLFSLIFIGGFFLLLFSLFHLNSVAVESPQTTDGNLIDILVILLGVLTAGVAQIMNYWFNKDNRTENSAEIKDMFKRIAERKVYVKEEKKEPENSNKEKESDTSATENKPTETSHEVVYAKPIAPKNTRKTPPKKATAELPPTILEASGDKGHGLAKMRFLLDSGFVKNSTLLESVAEYYELFEKKYNINTDLRRAHFFAQLAHESAGFSAIIENLNYSKTSLRKVFSRYFTLEQAAEYERKPEKIANRVYANRMGNKNEASGDGWKYRGRGFIQLTGKNNYQAFSNAVGVDFVNNPDLILQPQYILECAGWFWTTNNLNKFADKDDIKAITKAINGGENGITDRIKKLTILKARLKSKV